MLLANALIDIVQQNDLDALRPEHMRIFSYCMGKPPHSNLLRQPSQSDGWLKVFQKFKDYLLVSICDEELVDDAL